MLRIACICSILILSSCATLNKKPVLPADYVTRQDFEDMQNNMIKQMEATIELVHQDNKATRGSVKKTVSDCLCPSWMK